MRVLGIDYKIFSFYFFINFYFSFVFLFYFKIFFLFNKAMSTGISIGIFRFNSFILLITAPLVKAKLFSS